MALISCQTHIKMWKDIPTYTTALAVEWMEKCRSNFKNGVSPVYTVKFRVSLYRRVVHDVRHVIALSKWEDNSDQSAKRTAVTCQTTEYQLPSNVDSYYSRRILTIPVKSRDQF